MSYRKNFQSELNYYSFGGSNAAIKAEEEKNVRAGKSLVKTVLVVLAFVTVLHFTTACDSKSVFCAFTPSGESTFICGK